MYMCWTAAVTWAMPALRAIPISCAACPRVFPLFFFAVAALVCITTMTRMVDEQRTQAGVLKAMGYSNGAIMSVYFLYAGSASDPRLRGRHQRRRTIFLPKLIWQAYNIMYGFADILFAFDWPLALGSVGAYLHLHARDDVVRHARRSCRGLRRS